MLSNEKISKKFFRHNVDNIHIKCYYIFDFILKQLGFILLLHERYM